MCEKSVPVWKRYANRARLSNQNCERHRIKQKGMESDGEKQTRIIASDDDSRKESL